MTLTRNQVLIVWGEKSLEGKFRSGEKCDGETADEYASRQKCTQSWLFSTKSKSRISWKDSLNVWKWEDQEKGKKEKEEMIKKTFKYMEWINGKVSKQIDNGYL